MKSLRRPLIAFVSVLCIAIGAVGTVPVTATAEKNVADVDDDGVVNMKDYTELARHWLGYNPSVDIAVPPSGDHIVDFRDLAVLSEFWLSDFRLLAHWRLDETEGDIAHDDIADNDGHLFGAAVWVSGGRVDGALRFDGLDDHVQTDFVLNPANKPFSALTWTKAGGPGQAIISQTSIPGTTICWLCADPEDGRLMTALRSAGPSGSPLVSEFGISDGDWHHVGVVWDGTGRHLYVDGTEVAKDNEQQPNLEPSNGSLRFGVASTDDAASFWRGLIDDIRVYDQALQAGEIKELLRGAHGPGDTALERAKQVQETYTDTLLAKEAVVGTAVGFDQNYKLVIQVLTAEPNVADIPEELDGISTDEVVTGEFYALGQATGVATADDDQDVDPTARFPRPVPIGVSTGHPGISAGTIACRVKDDEGNVYALSNNHVYAKLNTANIGDNVLQPGAYDGGEYPEDAIGTLFDFEPIVFSGIASNVIDAAIARCSVETLDNDSPADGYGTPRSKTSIARLHHKVQKYGRTTRLTEGRITGVNAIVLVLYYNPDYDPSTGTGGPPLKIARFVEQFLVEPGSDFAQGGDSGSLVVTPSRKAVGLLFAGSSSYTVCNPIAPILERFDVAIDDE